MAITAEDLAKLRKVLEADHPVDARSEQFESQPDSLGRRLDQMTDWLNRIQADMRSLREDLIAAKEMVRPTDQ